MTTVLAERRKASLFRLAIAAAALAAIAAVTVAIDIRAASPDVASGPVISGLADSIRDAQRIRVTTSDGSYRIERVQRGEQRVWVMRDRGDYPVLGARLEQLTRGLEGLAFTRRMTSDPAKLARLGVDDPRHGGRGILVQIEDGRGAFLVNLILGEEPNGLYVRPRPDQPQTFAAKGELPPLRDVSSWLDLKPIDLDGQLISRVEVQPATGPAYALARDNPDADFAIVLPARLAAISPSALTAAAERITHLAPIDVQTAPAIQGAPHARLKVTTTTGIEIDADLIQSDNKTWLKLAARPALAAPTPEQQQAALAINNRAAGWAFALSPEEADNLAPPLNTLVPQRAPEHVRPGGAAPTQSRPAQ